MATFWLEPRVESAQSHGLRRGELSTALELVREHENVICEAWRAFHGNR